MRKRTGSLCVSLCLIVSLCIGFLIPVSAYNYSTGYPNTHSNTGNQRADVVAIAETQVGYTEADDGSTKYGAWWQEYVGSTSYNFVTADWCAMFISWCAAQAGASNVYSSNSAQCSYILSKYQAGQSGNTAYAFGSGYTPRPGDIIFVCSSDGVVNHNGLIVEVTDSTIYTVEGNSSNKVNRVSYSLSDGYRTGSSRRISYFGVPNYANDSEPNFDNTTSVTPGTGNADTVGTPVDPYQVTVTAQSGLNVRAAASSSAAAISTLAYQTEVTIVAESKDSSGNLWGKLSSGGWICLKYTSANTQKPESGPTITEITAYQATVSCDSLNVRNAPGLSGSKVNTLTKGATVTVSAISNADDMEWGKIGDNQWIATAYLKKVTADQPSTDTPSVETPDASGGTVYVVTGTSVNLRKGAGTNYAVVGTVVKGDKVTVVATKNNWGKLDSGSWICMDYVKKADSGSSSSGGSDTTTAGTYIVTGTNVNLRSGAGTSNAVVGSVSKGDTVTIVATNGNWGKLDSGAWICMDFVKQGGSSSDTTTGDSTSGNTGSGTTYTVTGTNVNLRSGAGTTYAVVGSVSKGDQITVVSTSSNWGQLDDGSWICMDYVKKTGSSSGNSSGSASGTTYMATDGVNVRSGAGTNYPIVGGVYAGQTVTIVAISGNWGQMEDGNWVCLDYFRA